MTEWGLSMAGCEETISYAAREAMSKTKAPFTYLEIGVAAGDTFKQVCRILAEQGEWSWEAIGVELPNGCEGFMIQDAWCLDQEAFYRNTEPYKDRVTLVRAVSQEWLAQTQESFHLALIDGCHEKDCVKADFLALEPKVPVGGCVIFHDTALWSQGDSPQPHKGLPIDTRLALQELGLLPVTRLGWAFVAEADGVQDQGGRGCMVFQRTGEAS